MYAELHALSNFSFLRGASHPEELVARAKSLGYRALAITDECSLAGVVRAHVAAKTANQATKPKASKKPPQAAKNAGAARDGSKAAKVLDLLRRHDGATLTELMNATGWQAHSVRGFLSGTVGKKMGLAVASAKGDAGERAYSVKS